MNRQDLDTPAPLDRAPAPPEPTSPVAVAVEPLPNQPVDQAELAIEELAQQMNIDPQLLELMMQALDEHPEGQDLPPELKLQVCQEAHLAGQCSNLEWLSQCILRLRAEALAAITTSYHELTIPAKIEVKSKEDLDQVLAQHRLWQESVLDPNKDIVGGRANLSDSHLQQFDLSGYDLRGARMTGIVMDEVILAQANLATAQLQKARLKGCDLRGAKLKRCDLSYARFEACNLEGVDLTGAVTHSVYFDEATKVSMGIPDVSASIH